MPRPTQGGGTLTTSNSNDLTEEEDEADEAVGPSTQSPQASDDSDDSNDDNSDDPDDDDNVASTQEREACPMCSLAFRSQHALMLHIRSAHSSLSADTSLADARTVAG